MQLPQFWCNFLIKGLGCKACLFWWLLIPSLSFYLEKKYSLKIMRSYFQNRESRRGSFYFYKPRFVFNTSHEVICFWIVLHTVFSILKKKKKATVAFQVQDIYLRENINSDATYCNHYHCIFSDILSCTKKHTNAFLKGGVGNALKVAGM